METKSSKPKTILGIKMDTEFLHLQQLLRKELKGISYPQQWLVIRYLPLSLLAKLSKDTSSLMEIATMHATRPTNMLRAELKLQNNKEVCNLIPNTTEEVLKLLKPHGNFSASDVTRNLLSILFTEFLVSNPHSSLTGFAANLGISKVDMFNLVKSTNATLLYQSKESKETQKIILPNLDDRLKSIEKELAVTRANQSILLNALLSLATSNPKVYANLKTTFGEAL